jgi:hypothetical protein
MTHTRNDHPQPPKMQTYFVSCLSRRIIECLEVLGRNGIALLHTDSDAGFAIMQIVCTQEQANTVWAAGFNVSEQ